MKSKSDIPSRTDYMKYSAFNFIENEKAHSEREKIQPSAAEAPDFASQSQSTTLFRCHGDLSSGRENGKEMVENSISRQITDVRIEPGVFSPKRYVTTCYLKCYMQPFWYSETMFLSIGSTRKRHEEHVMFKNKLIPAQWSETMTTEIGDAKVYSANIEIPVEDSDYHYISLEPQQIAAKVKQAVTAN